MQIGFEMINVVVGCSSVSVVIVVAVQIVTVAFMVVSNLKSIWNQMYFEHLYTFVNDAKILNISDSFKNER